MTSPAVILVLKYLAIYIQIHALSQLHRLYVNQFQLLHYQNLNQENIFQQQHELHISEQLKSMMHLGEKVVFTGVLEDSKSKVSFVSHKIAYPLIRDSIYNINSAYVHEFPDRSLLLVITEFTKLEQRTSKIYVNIFGFPRLVILLDQLDTLI